MLYNYKAFVLKVIDGDTIDLEIDLGFTFKFKQRVRLYGVNAPETHSKDPKEKLAGLKTMEWLQKIVEGREVIVHTFKDADDKFGRLLAEITLMGGSSKEPVRPIEAAPGTINAELIKEGLAQPYYGGKR